MGFLEEKTIIHQEFIGTCLVGKESGSKIRGIFMGLKQ